MSHKLFATLGAFLLALPVFLLFGAGLAQNPLLLVPLPAAALLLALLVRFFRRGRAFLCAVAMALFAAGALHILLPLRLGYGIIVPVALGAAMIAVHLRALCQPAGEEYAPVMWHLGIVVHAVSLFLMRAEALSIAKPLAAVLSPLYFAYVIFALNEHTVMDGMAGDLHPSRLMRLRNRVRSAVIAGVMLFCAYFQGISRAFYAAVDAVIAFVMWLWGLLFPDKPIEKVAAEGGGKEFFDMGGDVAEPALIWRILEKIMIVVALLAAALLVLILLRQLYKVIKRLVRYLIDRLRAYASSVNDAYEDTVESLLDLSEVKRSMLGLRRRLRPRPREHVAWDSLSPRDTVRESYRLLRKKSAGVADSRTARSALLEGGLPVAGDDAQRLADLYDAARYSSMEVAPGDAQSMRQAAQSAGKMKKQTEKV